MKPTTTLYLGGVKIPETSDETWVGMGIEVFKAWYPGGRDGTSLDGSGVPMGAWVTTVFAMGIVVAFGTIVEWAI